MSVTAPPPTAALVAARSSPPRAGRIAAAAVAAAALVTALATCTWLVLIAADRPSPLSGAALRAGAPRLLGPLAGIGPAPSADPSRLGVEILVPLLVLLGAWLLAWATAPALPERLVTAVGCGCQLVFVLGPPQRLTDTFNYVVYSRMAAHGFDPYR